MQDKPPPALFDHCVEVWDEMNRRARDDVVEERPVRLFEGFTTKLFKELHLSVPYYSEVMNELRAMDCVRQIQRGGGGSPSKWALMQRPTIEGFRSQRLSYEKSIGHKRSHRDQQDQRIRDLHRRVTELESWRDSLWKPA